MGTKEIEEALKNRNMYNAERAREVYETRKNIEKYGYLGKDNMKHLKPSDRAIYKEAEQFRAKFWGQFLDKMVVYKDKVKIVFKDGGEVVKEV